MLAVAGVMRGIDPAGFSIDPWPGHENSLPDLNNRWPYQQYFEVNQSCFGPAYK